MSLVATPPSGAPPAEHVTDEHVAGGDAVRRFAVDVLDSRSRARLRPAAELGPGRYLAFDGPDGLAFLALEDELTYLGRSFAADVRLEEPSVSRRQAVIRSRAPGARVLDDGSLNGTWVNGRRVADAALSDGDVIRVGRVVLVYRELPRA